MKVEDPSALEVQWFYHKHKVHQFLMVVWETWIFITVRKIRAMLRKEFLPR